MLLQVLLRHLLRFCVVGDILVLATIWSCVNFFILTDIPRLGLQTSHWHIDEAFR